MFNMFLWQLLSMLHHQLSIRAGGPCSVLSLCDLGMGEYSKGTRNSDAWALL